MSVEEKKLGYAVVFIWDMFSEEVFGEEEEGLLIRKDQIPEEFLNCKEYPGDPYGCYSDWVIEFIDALSVGETIDWPEKVR